MIYKKNLDNNEILELLKKFKEKILKRIDIEELKKNNNLWKLNISNYISNEDNTNFFLDNLIIFYINDYLINKLFIEITNPPLKNLKNMYNSSILPNFSILLSLKDRLNWSEIFEREIFEKKNNKFTKEYLKVIDFYYENFVLQDKRKIYGLFSTPEFICNYILSQIPILKLNNELKILDNSCGIGKFLLNTINYLLKIKNNEKTVKDHKNIYLTGIDINPVALQIFLLNFIYNIKNNDEFSLNLFNKDALIFQNLEKYDVVIGNPPYYIIAKNLRNSKQHRLKRSHRTYISKNVLKEYSNYFSFNEKQVNIFNLFIEHGILNLKEGGYLGFIVPDIILTGMTSKLIRKFILDNCCIDQIVKINGSIFKDGGVSNVILILKKTQNEVERITNNIKIIFVSSKELKKGVFRVSHRIRQNNFMEFPNYNFAINIRPNDWDEIKVILNKLKKNELIKLKKISKISRGIEIGKSNSKIISKEDIKRNPNLNKNPNLVKVVSIDNILSYKIDYKNKRFPEKYIVFEPDNLRIYKNKSNYRTPKILIKRISKKIIAALDFKENYYCLDSVQILQLTSNTNYNIYFLLAVLNSEIFNKYYQLIYGNYKKLFTRVNKSYLIDLPIPKVNIEEQNEIASIVKELLKFENIKSNEFKELKKEIDKRIQYHYLDMYG